MLPDFLVNKYEHLKLLSRSHFASVYLAMQKSLGRKVVIKTLLSWSVTDDKANRRFEREGRILAQLDDPGVVKIFDYGKEQDTTFIVSEFVEGKSLKEILENGEKLEFKEALRIIKEIALILSRVHSKGIFHRDIKPSNIIIKEDGAVKLIDFGLAQNLGLENITLSGEVIGTPAYMSPEQISGKAIDFRSDIFSLGVVAYELLNGENPFVADSLTGVLNKVLNFKPKDLNNIYPSSISALLNKMLEKNPERRFKSCQEIGTYIDQIFSELATKKAPIRSRQIIPRIIAAAFIFLVLLAAVFYAVKRKNKLLNENINSSNKIMPVIAKDSDSENTLKNESTQVSGNNKTLVQKEESKRIINNNKKQMIKQIPEMLEATGELPTVAKDTSYLKLNVEPWANIYLNGEFAGQTPIPKPLKLMTEPTNLRLTNSDIGSWETIINVKPKETLDIFINLPERFAELSVFAEPWANIYVNGVEKGTTPLGKYIYLLPGKYEIAFRNPSFSPIVDTISLKPGEIKVENVKFSN
jgi:serine/threonine protein kinase